MTISLRNTILHGGILLTLCLGAASFIAILILSFGSPATAVIGGGAYFPPLVSFGASGYLVLYSILAGILLQTFFNKTVSSEMFFFVFFVISVSLESVRVGQIFIIVNNISPYYGVVLTRVVYFGRFFGVFCLFVSGLYATGIEYQRFEIVLGISALIAFTLAFSIPIGPDSTLPLTVNTVRTSGQVLAVYFALEMFSVLNFVLAAILHHDRTYGLMAAGLLAVIVGKDLLFFVYSIFPDIGAALLLAAGTALFGNRTHVVYLWS